MGTLTYARAYALVYVITMGVMRDRAAHKIIKNLSAAANRAEPGSPERARLTQSVDAAVMAMIERDEQQDAEQTRRGEWLQQWEMTAILIAGALILIAVFCVVVFSPVTLRT